MLIKKAILILLFLLGWSSQLALYAAQLDDWQKLMNTGGSNKFEGRYKIALESFNKAVALAEKEKLPPKCLPISLCRLTAVEVITNQIPQADSNIQKIVDLIKEQKAAGTLNPQVNFWAAALSDEYLSNTKPETREICLKRACYLKDLIYGDAHRECLECLNKLAVYYIDQGKTDKAIHFLTLIQSVMDKKYGKNPNGLGETLNQLALKCEAEHKYEQAKQLELAVIKIANNSSSGLHAGLPAFYSFLGMNAFAQGKTVEGQEYFSIAIKECQKAKSTKSKDSIANAKRYQLSLIPMSPIIE